MQNEMNNRFRLFLFVCVFDFLFLILFILSIALAINIIIIFIIIFIISIRKMILFSFGFVLTKILLKLVTFNSFFFSKLNSVFKKTIRISLTALLMNVLH